MKISNSNIVASIMSVGAFSLFSLLILGSCGTKDTYLLFTDSLAGVIGGAVLATQSPPTSRGLAKQIFDPLPQSDTACPEITDQGDSFANCLDFQTDKIIDSPGKYLRRYWGFCQFQGLQMIPWWRTYHRIEFPDQTSCNAFRNSTGGFTPANINANSLVNKSITLNFGLGPNGDEQNVVFSQDGNAQYLWSDFPTGFLESKQGGIQAFFPASNERVVLIHGLQVKNYKPVNGQINDPIALYIDMQNNPIDKVLTLFSDKTFSSIKVGDRLYERKEAALDFQYGDDYPLVVKYSGAVPVVLAGGKIRTQFNSNGVLGLSTISEDLRYEDSTCCWPSSGKITTLFNTLYSLPTVRRRKFTEEVIEFSSTCGQIKLIQSGGDSSDVPERTLQLYQCF